MRSTIKLSLEPHFSGPQLGSPIPVLGLLKIMFCTRNNKQMPLKCRKRGKCILTIRCSPKLETCVIPN